MNDLYDYIIMEVLYFWILSTSFYETFIFVFWVRYCYSLCYWGWVFVYSLFVLYVNWCVMFGFLVLMIRVFYISWYSIMGICSMFWRWDVSVSVFVFAKRWNWWNFYWGLFGFILMRMLWILNMNVNVCVILFRIVFLYIFRFFFWRKWYFCRWAFFRRFYLCLFLI